MTTSPKSNNSSIKKMLTYHKTENWIKSITKLFKNNRIGPWKKIKTKFKIEIKEIKKACK